MKSCLSLSLLTLACAGFTAEDGAAPAPAAPAPAVAPAADGTPTPAPAPATTGTTPAPAPAAQTVVPGLRPLHVAKVEELPPTLRLTLVVDGGYDSNVMLLPDVASGTGASREGSAMLGTEGRLDWRVWQDRQGFVKIGGVARQDNYSDAPVDSNSHYGGNVVASWMNAERSLIPALALSSNRYQLDGETVADDAFSRLSLAWRRTGSVDIAAIDAHRILYAQEALSDYSGFLVAGNLRHWFLMDDNQAGRRLELGLRGGRFQASADWQTYLTLRPDVALTWRFGDGDDTGNWRISASSGVEWRQYTEEIPGQSNREQQTLWDNALSAAYGLNATSNIGPFAGFTRRLDNLDGRTYNRWLAGIRLLVTIP